MSAVSFGSLLGGISHQASAEADERFWRCTFDVNDLRAQVGRRFGNGSPSQGKAVVAGIIETALVWFKKVNKEAAAAFAKAKEEFARQSDAGTDAPEKPTKLRDDHIGTLRAVLGFMDFKSGECIATYEMIAKAAGCERKTAIRHLKILRNTGFINWVRRCEATGNTEGQRVKAAPNSYFFEISHLASEAQIHLRQILKRRGIELAEHPDRKGSGPVPNKAMRLIERMAKGLASAADYVRTRKQRAVKEAEAAAVRAEMQLMGDLPTEKWAEFRHPGDLAAQEAYNARMGILPFTLESTKTALHSPLAEQG